LEVEEEDKKTEFAIVEKELLRFDLRKGFPEPLRDEVVVEDQIELYISGEHHTTFLCSRSQPEELAVGHLVTEGLIGKHEDITSLEVRRGEVHVNLASKLSIRLQGRAQLILTSCGSRGLKIPARVWMKAKRASADLSFRLNPQTIPKATMELNSRAVTFRRTGGTHAAALLDDNGEVLAFSEDIGRHNAIDKVIGKAILKGIDLKRTFLASTGRLTSEMVIKAVYAGVPAIVSISAPTDKAIKIAHIAGLTLIGFARGKRFNIYAHPERILA